MSEALTSPDSNLRVFGAMETAADKAMVRRRTRLALPHIRGKRGGLRNTEVTTGFFGKHYFELGVIGLGRETADRISIRPVCG